MHEHFRDVGFDEEWRFRELHRACLMWLDSLEEGTPLLPAAVNLNGDPAAVLGCTIAQPLRAVS